MEIGGYIEFPHFAGSVLHNEAIALNSARNCLAYLIEAKKIKKIAIPKFLCASIEQVCMQYDLKIRYYSIGKDFFPQDLQLENEECMYLVNYYGQISNAKINKIKELYERLIVDNVQAFFQNPVEHMPTIYTCRKFFGVTDGAYLYSDKKLKEELETDSSYNRMNFLFGRFEKTASEFYSQYTANNKLFKNESIKLMSPITENLMRSFEYEQIKNVRTENFEYLHKQFAEINKLELTVPQGAFAYPLYIENGAEIRKKLQSEKIYIPTLWPYVFDICKENNLEYKLAHNILPIPVDQRYGEEDMEYLIKKVKQFI